MTSQGVMNFFNYFIKKNYSCFRVKKIKENERAQERDREKKAIHRLDYITDYTQNSFIQLVQCRPEHCTGNTHTHTHTHTHIAT